MAIQQQAAFAFSQSQIGKRLDVIIDAALPEAEHAYVGRTWADAPEIDAAVYVTGQGLRVGQIVKAEIVGARGYDLIAVAGPALGEDDRAKPPDGAPTEALS
jgi:ribosomal protein S12 methylthiotransferase